jgi:hypothetical protein
VCYPLPAVTAAPGQHLTELGLELTSFEVYPCGVVLPQRLNSNWALAGATPKDCPWQCGSSRGTISPLPHELGLLPERVRLAVTPWGGLALVEHDDDRAGGVSAAGAFSQGAPPRGWRSWRGRRGGPVARLRVLRRWAWAEVAGGWATSRAGTPSLRSAGDKGGSTPEEEEEENDEESMDLFTFQARGGGGGRSSAAGAADAGPATSRSCSSSRCMQRARASAARPACSHLHQHRLLTYLPAVFWVFPVQTGLGGPVALASLL